MPPNVAWVRCISCSADSQLNSARDSVFEKMASCLSAVLEEVVDQVMVEEEEENENETEPVSSVKKVSVELEAKIAQCVEALNGLEMGDNLGVFRSHIAKQIKQAYLALKPPTDPLRVLLNMDVNCGSLMASEGKLWLQKVRGRLARKTSIRNPFEGEIVRTIPLEVFLCLKRAVQHSRSREIMDSVTFDKNSKAHVISFSTKEAVVFFFSHLTGLSAPAVTGYLKISQTGRFNGNTSVIVNMEKDFTFIYKIKPMQLCVCFHFGSLEQGRLPPTPLKRNPDNSSDNGKKFASKVVDLKKYFTLAKC